MAYSKIILNGETLMDVTSDTVAAASLLSGKTATKNDGTKVTGNIANKTASDLTASGATVTAAAGYYPSAVSKAVTTTTHPNPTAAITSSTGIVTASHTQGTGYVTGGTTTGTLNLTTQAGKTVTPTESAQTAVASYRWTTGPISVAAISSTYVGTGVTTRSAADLTASGSNVTAPAGYYSSAVSKSVAAGSAFPPAVTITKAPTIGVNTSGVVTASYNGSSSITPTVTSGYVSQGTAGTVSTTGTSTYQLTSKAAATYYPSTADQTIASQRWLVGNQTIKSVTTSNLTAANIKSGTVVKVGDSANASRITQVTGTLKEGVAYTAKIEGTGDSSNCYVQYNGNKYYTDGQTFTFFPEETINFYAKSNNGSGIVFGYGVYTSSNGSTASTYSYTAIGCNIIIRLYYSSNEFSSIGVDFRDNTFNDSRAEIKLDSTYGVVPANAVSPTSVTQHIGPSNGYYGFADMYIAGDSNLKAENIVEGVSIFGVTGTYAGTVPSGTSYIRADGTYNIASYSNVSISAIRNFVGGGVSSFYSSDTELTTIGHGKFAFEGLSSVNFPNVVQILNLAFYSCSKLTSINFSKCYTVGASAFYYCTSLNTAIFSICTDVGPQAFYDCERLSNIDFPQLQRIGSLAFYQTSITSVNFPKCSIIYNSAFQYCNSLKTIVFSSCTDIYSKAFYNCNQLFNANFPICSFIGGEAFGACYSLTSISFPSCITIGFSAFRNCSALTTVSFSVCQTISYDAFFSCSSLISISFPACTSISTSAFAQCYKLPSVFFPNCILVGNSAFYYCSSLSTISFPACTSIGSSAFAYCSALTSASFPNCITIGSAAFYQCDSLSIANFPECISLSYSAFYSCQNLVTVDFATCTSVGQNAFYNCRSLTTASFPVCKSIGTQAFYSCYHLISFYLNNVSAVPTLGGNAFYMTPLYNYSTLAGRYGSIFVPASLFESFKTATGWAAYSSRMVSV